MNEIVTTGLDQHSQDLIIKSAKLLLDDSNIVIVTDETTRNEIHALFLDRPLVNNGIRLYSMNTFHNTVLDYYLCQLVIDRSNFYTLREGHRDRGVHLVFCGSMSHAPIEGTLSIVPKSDDTADNFRRKVLSWLGFPNYIQSGNYLVDIGYEIESSSPEFARSILNKKIIESLSKSNSIGISIKEGTAYCDTGRKPSSNDMLLLKTILEHIPTGGSGR